MSEEFNGNTPTWCPGCGDWAIGACIKRAFADLNFHPWNVMVAFGIGCSGNMNDVLKSYGFHSLHGRALPQAIGMKLGQHKMPVVCVVGDGDCYGEGGNHILHASRGNHDITVVVHDNGVYGLTTGQVSPRSQSGQKSKSTPSGTLDAPLNPLALTLSQGATFVAQGFAGNALQLIDLIKKGVAHKGFSVINVLQPCVTFNKINTYEYYRDKAYELEAGYDAHNFKAAMDKALQSTQEEKFPLGVLYQHEKPTYTDQLPQLEEKQLIDKERFVDFGELTKEFCS
ncbi:MAG: 2-oxoglutarate oxidoreductase subunit KorB [Microgenomates bacterium OLB23]|nr:MAG: 2-oxoglutarate oxidoreductase subunit KorB [Microgenomates bacterium OLB23]